MWTHQKQKEVGGCSHCPDTGRGAFAKGSRSVAASSSAVCEQVGTTRYTHTSAIDQQFKRTHPAGGRRCCAAPPAALKRDAVRIKRDDIVLLSVCTRTSHQLVNLRAAGIQPIEFPFLFFYFAILCFSQTAHTTTGEPERLPRPTSDDTPIRGGSQRQVMSGARLPHTYQLQQQVSTESPQMP
jgi:hypothetical protein